MIKTPKYPHKLAACEGGVTAIEFAMVAPIVMLFMLGIIEFSLIMFTSAVMESATNNTARLGKTGYASAGKTRQQEIIANIKSRTAGLLNPTKIVVTTQVYSGFSQVSKPEPCISPVTAPCNGTAGVNFIDINGNGQWDADMAASGEGSAGDVVVYTATYPWPIFTPPIKAILGNTYTISSRTVIKNEPFGTAVAR